MPRPLDGGIIKASILLRARATLTEEIAPITELGEANHR